MKAIHWEIVPSPTGPYGFRVVDLEDANAPWIFFFTGVSLESYPQMIEAAVQGVGSGFDAVGVTFPADLDEWDIEERGGVIPDDAVEVYHHSFGATLLSQTTFYTILEAFAQRLVEQPKQATTWHEKMNTALNSLRTKLAVNSTSPSS